MYLLSVRYKPDGKFTEGFPHGIQLARKQIPPKASELIFFNVFSFDQPCDIILYDSL